MFASVRLITTRNRRGLSTCTRSNVIRVFSFKELESIGERCMSHDNYVNDNDYEYNRYGLWNRRRVDVMQKRLFGTTYREDDPLGDLEADEDEEDLKNIAVTKANFDEYKGEEYYQSLQKEESIKVLQDEIRSLHSSGKYDQALMAATELVEKCESHFGKSHPVTASAFNNMAVMHKMMGQFNEAKAKFHDALRIYDEIVGKKHLSYAAALHNLGILEKDQARLDENLSALDQIQLLESSIEQLQSALDIRRASLSEEHPDTISSRTNLGSAFLAQLTQASSKASKPKDKKRKGRTKTSKFTLQRWEDAETHLRTALEHSIENSHGDTELEPEEYCEELPSIRTLTSARSAHNLAILLKNKGESAVRKLIDRKGIDVGELFAESRRLYSSALHVRTKMLGITHQDTVASKFSLAELISFLGDEETANKLKNEIVESFEND